MDAHVLHGCSTAHTHSFAHAHRILTIVDYTTRISWEEVTANVEGRTKNYWDRGVAPGTVEKSRRNSEQNVGWQTRGALECSLLLVTCNLRTDADWRHMTQSPRLAGNLLACNICLCVCVCARICACVLCQRDLFFPGIRERTHAHPNTY